MCNRHVIYEKNYKKITINKSIFTGISQAARNTIIFDEDGNALDAGLTAPERNPPIILITHAHHDHDADLFNLIMDNPNKVVIFCPASNAESYCELIRINLGKMGIKKMDDNRLSSKIKIYGVQNKKIINIIILK